MLQVPDTAPVIMAAKRCARSMRKSRQAGSGLSALILPAR